jgi:D-tyrosyl-tRNA(Tyr) deacylase
MRALVQRVSEASVTVDGERVGAVGSGLLILVCAMAGDTEAEADKLAARDRKAPDLPGRGGPDEPVASRHRRRGPGG